jgi:hypothetical protein
MYHLRVPQTEEELELLPVPLGDAAQAAASAKRLERDAWDAMAHHQMVVDEEGNLVAVGRCISTPITKRLFALWPFIPPCRTKVWGR